MHTIMHQSSRYLVVVGFSYEKSAGCRYRQCFPSDKSCRKMYMIFSAVLCQQRKRDAITSFGHPVRSAIYYKAGSPCQWIIWKFGSTDYVAHGGAVSSSGSYLMEKNVTSLNTNLRVSNSCLEQLYKFPAEFSSRSIL
jgi:hypothetical protein